MKRKWVILFGVPLVLAAAVFAVMQFMQPVQVEVKKAEITNIKDTFTEAGVVVPAEERTVYSLHTAQVQELLVKEGSQVSKGELMVILDDSELRYTLKELEAGLSTLDAEKMQLERTPGAAELESYRYSIEEAAASLETAQQHLQRLEQLYREGVVSKTELEEAEELVRKTAYNLTRQEKALQALHESYEPQKGSREAVEAQRKAIHARIDLIRHQMENYRISAPISGLVTSVTAEEGGIASPQAPLLSLFRPDDYKVEVRVLTSEIHDIKEGVPVKLQLELRDGDMGFPGSVTAISPYAEKSQSPLGLEEERVKVTVKPDIPEDLAVGPGYRLDVEFTTAERSNIIVVPKTALFTSEGEDALLVVEDDRARIRSVLTGMETRQEVVISEGLSEGDLIILDPELSGIAEGAKVSYTIR